MAPDRTIRAYANCDDAYVVWRYDEPIPDCRGFALFRRLRGQEPSAVKTFVPFAGEPHKPGEARPSTVWPIQRFSWTDVMACNGECVAYQVVPLIGDALAPDVGLATEWTDEVDIGPQADPGLAAFFNRGVLATQSIARRLDATKPWTKRLMAMITTPGDRTRDYLSGEVRKALLDVLDEVKAAPEAVVHAALFELADPELLTRLCELKDRARVVLANGTDPPGDENRAARKALVDAGVTVHDRMVHRGHLSHDKFLVVCRSDGTASRVWTGSTNWTPTGLCTQVNNALLIDDAAVASDYLEQWNALARAGDDFPAELLDGDSAKRCSAVGAGSVTTWFTPVRDEVDLADARDRIANAKHGILFLMFNPGRQGTLFNAIMDRADPGSPSFDPDLYVHGVLNQDPEAGSHDPKLVNLIHRGELDEADPDIVLPSCIDKRFSSWEKEIKGLSIVMVHSKVVVLDPFGADPVVMTGSHNLGPKASTHNDDNLNIVTGAPRLAAAYATHIMAVYTNYRWRYVRSQGAKDAGKDWAGPTNDTSWQERFFTGADAPARQRELRFWLGEG